MAINIVLGLQWALPMGLDRSYRHIIARAAVIDVALAFALAPVFGAPGIAWTLVIAEAAITIGLLVILRRTRTRFLPASWTELLVSFRLGQTQTVPVETGGAREEEAKSQCS